MTSSFFRARSRHLVAVLTLLVGASLAGSCGSLRIERVSEHTFSFQAEQDFQQPSPVSVDYSFRKADLPKADWSLIGTSSTAPFDLVWEAPLGKFNVKAEGLDANGQRSLIADSQLATWLPPVVSLVEPSGEVILASGTPIVLHARVDFQEEPLSRVTYRLEHLAYIQSFEVTQPPFDLTLTNATPGNWTVSVFGSDCCQYGPSQTNNYLLLPSNGLPWITEQPTNWVGMLGTNATFSVSARVSSSAPLEYQWLHDGAPLPGATNATLSIPTVRAGDAGPYTVVIASPAGASPSRTAWLSPIDRRVTLRVSASLFPYSGDPPVLRPDSQVTLWAGPSLDELNPVLSRLSIFADSVSGPGSVSTIHPGGPMYCRLEIRSPSRSWSPRFTNLRSYSLPGAGPVSFLPVDGFWLSELYVGPGSSDPKIGAVDSDIVLTAGVSAFTEPPVTCFWRRNGRAIPGVPPIQLGAFGHVAPTLLLRKLSSADAATYSLLASNENTMIIGRDIPLQVTRGVVLRETPEPQSGLADSPLELHVKADGMAPIRYQWERNGVSIAGETNASLSFRPLRPLDEADYQVIVSNAFSTETASPARLKVISKPILVSSPEPQTIQAGETLHLTTDVRGPSLTYLWRRNLIRIREQTNATLEIQNIQHTDAGSYSVIVTNKYGAVYSAYAAIEVVGLPRLTALLTPRTVHVGMSVNWAAEVVGASPLQITWYRNGELIPGEQGTTLVLDPVEFAQAGSYRITVSNAWGKAQSVTTLSVLRDPIIFSTEMRVHEFVGAERSWNVPTYGSAPLDLRWLKNGRPWPNPFSGELILAPIQHSDSGRYTLIASNVFGVVKQDILNLTVHMPPRIAVTPHTRVPTGTTMEFRVLGVEPQLTYGWRNAGFSELGSDPGLTVTNLQREPWRVPKTLTVTDEGRLGYLYTSVAVPLVEVVDEPVLVPPSPSPDGKFVLRFLLGDLGGVFLLQESKDLIQWSAGSSVNVVDGVAVVYIDTPESSSRRFFRVAQKP